MSSTAAMNLIYYQYIQYYKIAQIRTHFSIQNLILPVEILILSKRWKNMQHSISTTLISGLWLN